MIVLLFSKSGESRASVKLRARNQGQGGTRLEVTEWVGSNGFKHPGRFLLSSRLGEVGENGCRCRNTCWWGWHDKELPLFWLPVLCEVGARSSVGLGWNRGAWQRHWGCEMAAERWPGQGTFWKQHWGPSRSWKPQPMVTDFHVCVMFFQAVFGSMDVGG